MVGASRQTFRDGTTIPYWRPLYVSRHCIGSNHSDVNPRYSALPRPPSASSKFTIGSGTMPRPWLLRKFQQQSCGQGSTKCFRSSESCLFGFPPASWFSECHRLEKQNNDTLELFICSWFFSSSSRLPLFSSFASNAHQLRVCGIDHFTLTASR